MTMPFDDVQVITVESDIPGAPTTITVQVPGVQGPPGVFLFGNIATGDPGTNASATVATDSGGNSVINLTIPRGDTGVMSTLTMGSVSTVDPAAPASATLTGSAPDYTLNLSIPKGAKGDTGSQGIQGPQGPVGPAGQDGQGIEIAGEVATYADLPTNLTSADAGKAYIVDADGLLYIWSGTGFPANGAGKTFVGPAGPANTLSIGTITTGAPGSAADATITGTAPNQVLNLTLPQGATGAGVAAGGAPGDLAVKNSSTDYDLSWTTPTSSATASTLVKRDANGRAQVIDPSASADIATKNYVDTQDLAANRTVYYSSALAGDYTVGASDEGKMLSNNPAPTAMTVTLPNSSTLPNGYFVDIVRHGLAGLTIAGDGTSTLGYGGNYGTGVTVSMGRYSVVRAVHLGGSAWYLYHLTIGDSFAAGSVFETRATSTVAGSSANSTSLETSLINTTFAATANRKYKWTIHLPQVYGSVDGDRGRIFLYGGDSGGILATAYFRLMTGGGMPITLVTTGSYSSTGTKNVKVTMTRDQGTGGWTAWASATGPMLCLIEDIGPA